MIAIRITFLLAAISVTLFDGVSAWGNGITYLGSSWSSRTTKAPSTWSSWTTRTPSWSSWRTTRTPSWSTWRTTKTPTYTAPTTTWSFTGSQTGGNDIMTVGGPGTGYAGRGACMRECHSCNTQGSVAWGTCIRNCNNKVGANVAYTMKSCKLTSTWTIKSDAQPMAPSDSLTFEINIQSILILALCAALIGTVTMLCIAMRANCKASGNDGKKQLVEHFDHDTDVEQGNVE